jgi:hypothetical protein
MSTNMNSSAFSDDGQFSTRARRNFGTSDLEYNPPIRVGGRGEIDGMGLSTQVEISDRGSRRHAHHHNEERIDEVDDESGRTSPPGTIGEAHEYMSENIESKVKRHKKNKGTGNQSVLGKDKVAAVSNIVRNGGKNAEQNSSDTGYSNIAQIRDKIELKNNERHILMFQGAFEKSF